MTPEKIVSIADMYIERLRGRGFFPVRMEVGRTFQSLTRTELLAHAYYLCENVKKLAVNPEEQGKARRHLSAAQMCLSFAGWYTLRQMMEHNMPEGAEFVAE